MHCRISNFILLKPRFQLVAFICVKRVCKIICFISTFLIDVFFIDASDFVQLIASQVGRRLTDQQIANLSSAFNQLAEILSEDQFALDLNLIQPENDAVLEIDKVDLPAIVTDKLFILAQAHHTDIVALDNGFEISFNEDLKLYLTQRLDPIGHSQWSFKVVDLYDQWSLMAVLAKYDWFLNWYLDDLAKLQIAYRREFFCWMMIIFTLF